MKFLTTPTALAKMEEEAGNLDACRSILLIGLSYCQLNESLMVKCLKHHERMGQLSSARSLLARLRSVNIDKTWRTVMEGALLEARQGNDEVAREVFKHLIKYVPWYGPIYHEYCRFEEKCERKIPLNDNHTRGVGRKCKYFLEFHKVTS